MFPEDATAKSLKPFILILPMLVLALLCVAALQPWSWQKLASPPALPTVQPRASSTPVLALVSAAPAPTGKAAAPLAATPTSTRVVAAQGKADPVPLVSAGPETGKDEVLAQLQQDLQQIHAQRAKRAAPLLSYNWDSPLVLAHYFAWYDGNGWDGCNISAGDKPLEPYHSDDPAAIARHIGMAREIGLNGFLLHWFAPDDRTDRNFKTLLQQAEGQEFASTVVFSRHIWNGIAADPANIAAALQHITHSYGTHPNFLRLENKPVIFFTDVYRTPATGQTPQQFWTAIRDQIDPQRQAWWIAEGLDASYLNVFDGLYVFKVSHADYPHDYLKSPRWGARVRAIAQQLGQPKLWLATMSPGWDDLRASCKPDVRVPNKAHRLDRAEGDIYRASFRAALDSSPDWLLVGSFNEWVEGTYIEPSLQHGDQYMGLTREFIEQFRQISR